MPSDAFIGILTGLGSAHRARQKNMFDQEQERREKMASAFEKLAEHPDMTEEGRDEYYRKAFGIRTLDPNKKVPAEDEKFITAVAPKFGQSWLGGKTEQSMKLEGAPISTSLPGQTPSEAPGAQTRTLAAPMPEPPPGTQRSAFYSPQEQSQRKIADAVAMLQALGPIQQQQALDQRRGESAIDLEEEKAKQAMKPVTFSTAPAGSSIVNDRTGEITGQAPKPETPPNLTNFSREEVKLDGKGPVTVLRDLDPASPNVGRVFLPTPQGMQDVTGRTSIYEKPAQPPFIIRNEAAVTNAAGELPREWRNAMTRAMRPDSSQATRLARLNEAASYLEAGDTEGLKSRIRQLAIEGESVGTQAQVEGRADAMNAMKDAVGLMEQMKREGISTNILTGTWEDILRKLGTTSHPKRVEFSSRMQRALSAYTLAMSGVQFSEAEAARYLRLFPNYSNTMPVNETLAKSLLNAMSTEDRRFWNQKLGEDGARLVGAVDAPAGERGGVNQREIVTYQGRRYYLVGREANGDAILEPAP